MRVFRKARGVRTRLARRVWARRATVVALGRAGLLAVLALVVCAVGGDRRVVGRERSVAAPLPAGPHRAARPVIVPRSRWLDAGSTHAQPPARYDDHVVAVFVHHTDSPNAYECADVPRIIRSLYAVRPASGGGTTSGTTSSSTAAARSTRGGRAGWKTGRRYRSAYAGVQPWHRGDRGHRYVRGGDAGAAMTEAIASLAAWKLGLSDVNYRATVRLVSSNDLSRYTAGTVVLPTLAGHDAGFMTNCPGAALASPTPPIRSPSRPPQGR